MSGGTPGVWRAAAARTQRHSLAPEIDTTLPEGQIPHTRALKPHTPAAGPRTHFPPPRPPLLPLPPPREAGCEGKVCCVSGAAEGSGFSACGSGLVGGALHCPSAGTAHRVEVGVGAWRAAWPGAASRVRSGHVRPLRHPSGGSEAPKTPQGSRSGPARSAAHAHDGWSDRTSASPRQMSARRLSRWRNGARQMRWTSSPRAARNKSIINKLLTAFLHTGINTVLPRAAVKYSQTADNNPSVLLRAITHAQTAPPPPIMSK